jgi:hypothetical protein
VSRQTLKDGRMTLSALQNHLRTHHGVMSRPFKGRVRVQWDAYHAELHDRRNEHLLGLPPDHEPRAW